VIRNVEAGTSGLHESISLLVGEMAGRPEGGVLALYFPQNSLKIESN
jgi:hypothetical protein